MAQSKVYFISARAKKWKYKYSVLGRLEEVIEKIKFEKYFKPKELVAIKLHLGTQGVHRNIKPVFLNKIVQGVKNVGAYSFITDTSFGKDSIEKYNVAKNLGINELTCNAPIIMADGIFGFDCVEVDMGELIGKIGVASAIYDASAMIVASHIKAHIQSGYAGAIKNLAMGALCGARREGNSHEKARGRLHSLMSTKIKWVKEKCTKCEQCIDICPLEGLFFNQEGNLVFGECYRCTRCVRICQQGALIDTSNKEVFQEGLAYSAKGVINTFKKNKILYFNFLLDITPECDCIPVSDTPIVQDQGILISDDIVAVEKASYDMITNALPLPQSLADDRKIKDCKNIFQELHNCPAFLHIEKSRELNLGNMDYEIIEI
ncbi:MAG: DUF362 domain-containing protein [bacterium]